MDLPFYPSLNKRTTKKRITTPLFGVLILSILEAMEGDVVHGPPIIDTSIASHRLSLIASHRFLRS
jgi:hypothetical protein